MTKPGIIYGNLITAAAGFLFACDHQVYWRLLLETLLGIALVIGAACVFNNVLDKDIDARMSRTRSRALPAGKISVKQALIFASALTVAGFTDLAVFTNWYVFGLGFISIYFYVVVYGVAKRRTVHGTLVGSIPGAAPPAAGYLAVTNHIDSSAVLLFLALVFWQMPHFYAISMYRYKDYKAAGIPVLAVKKGMASARRQIIAYIIAYAIVIALLSEIGKAGHIYLAGGLILVLYWLYKTWRGWGLTHEKWGRQMFFASLIVSLGWSILTAFGSRLP